MRRIDPHHYAYAVLDALESGVTPVTEKARVLLSVVDGTEVNEVLRYAWNKYDEPIERTIIESFLLAEAPIENISKVTGVSPAVIKAYNEYIFDTLVFRDRLERISYVAKCRGYLPRDQFAYLESALTRGWEYLAWLLSHTAAHPPRKVLEVVMAEGLYMGLAHRGTQPETERAKQAKAWLQTGVAAATTLLRVDPNDDADALSELRLALVPEDTVSNAETTGAPAPEDIVH